MDFRTISTVDCRLYAQRYTSGPPYVGVTVHVCATGHYFLAGMFTHRKPSVYISPGAETLVVSHRALRCLVESSAAWVHARMAVIIWVFLDYRNQSGMVPI